ncbi:N-acetylglucosamine kinase [Vibrio quintilis]|uniref:N-acetylglucosamine kinase n=1 Tax=Vibrio quintilis TaxID=1117707 RepID=UPI0021C9C8CE|nr:N-acetylglucosamine kinase [Vibrio quintilis]
MYYGFDIGGTKIEFGAFNENLERVAIERIQTPTGNYEKLLTVLAELVEKYDFKFGSKGLIGLGLPGIENADDSTVLTANVLSANGRPLRSDLELKIRREVKIENDANCFALSEAWDDELKEESFVMGLILGTGFGGGLIHHGKVFSGKNNVAGEIGHIRLPIDAWFYLGSDKAPLFNCGCGKSGCIDNYLSGRGFELLYEHYFGEKRKAVDIIHAYDCDDYKAVEHVERFMEVLAICLGNIFTAYDPNVVVLGGGLSNFNLIYDELPQRISKYLLPIAKSPRIIKAKYGDSGGVRGAAFLNIM